MYYDAPPAMDERYARRTIFIANRELAHFIKLYTEARERNDRGFYIGANQQRAVVAAELARLGEEATQLPDQCQGMVEEVRAKIRESLDSHPEFPPPLINNDTAVEAYTRRVTKGQTSSEIVANLKNPNGVIQGSVVKETENLTSPTHPPIHAGNRSVIHRRA